MNFQIKLKKYKEIIDKELDIFTDYSFIKEFVLNGGKRLRPIVFIMSYKAVNDKDEQSIYIPSLSVELVHNSTLVHDDIMDEDELRRGKPTVYKDLKDWFLKCQKYSAGLVDQRTKSATHYEKRNISEHAQEPLVRNGRHAGRRIASHPVRDERFLTNYKDVNHQGSLFNNISSRFAVSNAILYGNILLSLGFKALLRSQHKKINEAVDVLNNSYKTILDGQMMDLMTEFKQINEKEYFEMISKKTAELFKASIKIGALLGDASKEQINNLTDYSKEAATAFQIKDDIMDISTEMNKGHELGSDIKQGKKNLLIIKALEFADEKEKKLISGILGKESTSSEEVNSVIDIMKSTGAIDYSNKLAKEKIKTAKEYLKKAEINKESSDFFEKLADFTIKRKI